MRRHTKSRRIIMVATVLLVVAIPLTAFVIQKLQDHKAAAVSAAAQAAGFNDDNFYACVVRSYGHSASTDTVLTDEQLASISYVGCNSSNISNTDGLEKLTGLESLYLAYNQLTSIDVSKNTALTNLSISSNQLTSLDVSKNTELIELDIEDNQLTSIDISTNTELTKFISDNIYVKTSLRVIREGSSYVYVPQTLKFWNYEYSNEHGIRNGSGYIYEDSIFLKITNINAFSGYVQVSVIDEDGYPREDVFKLLLDPQNDPLGVLLDYKVLDENGNPLSIFEDEHNSYVGTSNGHIFRIGDYGSNDSTYRTSIREEGYIYNPSGALSYIDGGVMYGYDCTSSIDASSIVLVENTTVTYICRAQYAVSIVAITPEHVKYAYGIWEMIPPAGETEITVRDFLRRIEQGGGMPQGSTTDCASDEEKPCNVEFGEAFPGGLNLANFEITAGDGMVRAGEPTVALAFLDGATKDDISSSDDFFRILFPIAIFSRTSTTFDSIDNANDRFVYVTPEYVYSVAYNYADDTLSDRSYLEVATDDLHNDWLKGYMIMRASTEAFLSDGVDTEWERLTYAEAIPDGLDMSYLKHTVGEDKIRVGEKQLFAHIVGDISDEQRDEIVGVISDSFEDFEMSVYEARPYVVDVYYSGDYVAHDSFIVRPGEDWDYDWLYHVPNFNDQYSCSTSDNSYGTYGDGTTEIHYTCDEYYYKIFMLSKDGYGYLLYASFDHEGLPDSFDGMDYRTVLASLQPNFQNMTIQRARMEDVVGGGDYEWEEVAYSEAFPDGIDYEALEVAYTEGDAVLDSKKSQMVAIFADQDSEQYFDFAKQSGSSEIELTVLTSRPLISISSTTFIVVSSGYTYLLEPFIIDQDLDGANVLALVSEVEQSGSFSRSNFKLKRVRTADFAGGDIANLEWENIDYNEAFPDGIDFDSLRFQSGAETLQLGKKQSFLFLLDDVSEADLTNISTTIMNSGYALTRYAVDKTNVDPAEDANPKTGDNASILFTIAGGAAAVVLCGVFSLRRRR